MGRKRTKSGKIRLAEVAELAGVSPITASRFFRNPEALSVAKRARVDSAAKELGYVPIGSTPDGFRARIASDIAKWSRIIEAGNIKPN